MGIIEQLQTRVNNLEEELNNLRKLLKTSDKEQEHGFVHLSFLRRKHKLSLYMARQIRDVGIRCGMVRVAVHQTRRGSTVQLIDERSYSEYVAKTREPKTTATA